MEAKYIFSSIVFVGLALFLVNADPVEDKQALLDFVNKLHHSRLLNWNESSPVCSNWTGVTCSKDGSRVIALRLPGVGFQGPIPSNTISRLSALQVLSLRSNLISGEFPSDFFNLKNLSFLYLQYNNLSGSLPVDFSVWSNLTIINLSNNRFNGSIPLSLSNLTHLAALNLANNSLSGEIPDFTSPNLQVLNLSNNNLTGGVPKSLRRFPNSVFSGNNISFPNSAPHASPVFPPSTVSDHKSKNARGLGEKALLGIIVAACVLGLVAFSFLIIVCCSRKKGQDEFSSKLQKGEIAYYYSKDEKLMVYDYYTQGSVSSILHGKRGGERISLDWDTRMRIAIGAARGIARIHTENGGKFVHGNIKSSNIFLNSRQYGCVSDLGLSTIMSPLAAPISRAAGYRAPEVTDTRKAGQPADVYSFGVVLLELLTGKSPIHTTGGDEIIHLVRWVHSVVREEWTAEVFDVELMRFPNIEEEMVEMLQIALSCVVRIPDQRPKMPDVVKMIESVRRIDTDNRPSSENRSQSSTPTPPPPVMETDS
ncbi:ATP binding protein, putative [Ricinus communis]|uniref:ATP binding protein, putative n=1 Tax=Ricinus communis TaxID=3988 RepID=B9RCN2_RICCO|nr:ATP binding protein, putative [Ricinus communis]